MDHVLDEPATTPEPGTATPTDSQWEANEPHTPSESPTDSRWAQEDTAAAGAFAHTPDQPSTAGSRTPAATAFARLTALGEFDGRLAHQATVPARPGTTAPWPEWADPQLVAAYRAQGITRPYLHQVQAAEHLHAGRHTVISTGTGSGKSLPLWLTALSAIRADDLSRVAPAAGSIAHYHRRPTVLYLAPTKALAHDQLQHLTTLLRQAQLTSIQAATLDGDTPFAQRDWVRDHADVVLTNPDFLHVTLLPGHRHWVRLLRGLRYVVVDESHAYRGVLGAHVALVLRRLLRLARHLGAAPAVYVASATAAHPARLAARLIGDDDVAAVDVATSPEGARRIALWRCAAVDGVARAATSEAAELLADLVAQRVRTLVFVRSRASAEYVAGKAREILTERQATLPGAAELAGRVGAYRGGYLPEERRELEAALRSGQVLALATTNALELGIDVAGLDAVITAGWPGSRASLWQQLGRAGRAGQEGYGVFVAGADPLEQYLIEHPDALLGTVEDTVFDPSNPYVLAPHLCAAASELPITEADFALFGPRTAAVLERLVELDLLRRRPTGWFWNIARGGAPAALTDLRGSGGETQIVSAETGAILGTVNAGAAEAAVHPGATYIHRGDVYVVEALEDDVALVRAGDPGYRTRAQSVKTVRVVDVERRTVWGAGADVVVEWGFGTVDVTSQVVGYDRLLPPGMEIVGHYPLEMPEGTLRTSAVWFTIPAAAAGAGSVGVAADVLPGALHAAEHAMIGLLPLLATCDRWDIGGLSTAAHPDTGLPTVFVYDGVPGGAGFAERGYEAAREWVAATRDLIAACPCEAGCPACVQSPKCGNGNQPLDKAGAVAVLSAVLRAAG